MTSATYFGGPLHGERIDHPDGVLARYRTDAGTPAPVLAGQPWAGIARHPPALTGYGLRQTDSGEYIYCHASRWREFLARERHNKPWRHRREREQP